jgi:hypothetical protein
MSMASKKVPGKQVMLTAVTLIAHSTINQSPSVMEALGLPFFSSSVTR